MAAISRQMTEFIDFVLFLYSNFKKFILTLCTDCEKYISINTYLTRVVVRTAHYGSYVAYDYMYM